VNPFPDKLVDTNDVLQADHGPFRDRRVERDPIKQQLGICRQETQALGDKTDKRKVPIPRAQKLAVSESRFEVEGSTK
jgi:hypothetical protein